MRAASAADHALDQHATLDETDLEAGADLDLPAVRRITSASIETIEPHFLRFVIEDALDLRLGPRAPRIVALDVAQPVGDLGELRRRLDWFAVHVRAFRRGPAPRTNSPGQVDEARAARSCPVRAR
jgi:hypothetical protein